MKKSVAANALFLFVVAYKKTLEFVSRNGKIYSWELRLWIEFKLEKFG